LNDLRKEFRSGEEYLSCDFGVKTVRTAVENVLAPEDVRRIRLKMGLTQRQAGTLIGGGPNAFQKYEAGRE
jgi:HTH-type transcriptional regulator/antitoxin MqsA